MLLTLNVHLCLPAPLVYLLGLIILKRTVIGKFVPGPRAGHTTGVAGAREMVCVLGCRCECLDVYRPVLSPVHLYVFMHILYKLMQQLKQACVCESFADLPNAHTHNLVDTPTHLLPGKQPKNSPPAPYFELGSLSSSALAHHGQPCRWG